MTQNKVTPMVDTVEVHAGCPAYCYTDKAFTWDDKNIRCVFVHKVYFILMLQLFVTVAVVTLCTFYAPVKFYIQTHPVLYSACTLLFLGTYLTLACCGDVRRQFPWNLILLTIFTLCMAGTLGFVSSYYNTKSVLLCLVITATVCFCVTVFSFQSKIDVSSYQGLLIILCMVLLFCAVLMGFVVPFGYVPWLHGLYGSVGAIVFTMFLAFDTQLLMGKQA